MMSVIAVEIERKVGVINRTALAKQLGLDRSHVSQILNGKHEPGLGVAKRIASAIGLTLDEFAGWHEERKAVN